MEASGPGRALNESQYGRFESLRPPQLAAILQTKPVAWLPVSPLEWHGEALPFGTDALTANAITERAWKLTGGVLLPLLPLGVETDYKQWEAGGLKTYQGLEVVTKQRNPGSLYVRSVTLELVLVDYLTALERQGFRVGVVVSAHLAFEHMQVLQEVCARPRSNLQVLLWRTLAEPAEVPAHLHLTANDGGHADIIEASIMSAIAPSSVDLAVFGTAGRDRSIGLSAENVQAIDPAKGRALVEYNAAQLSAQVTELLG